MVFAIFFRSTEQLFSIRPVNNVMNGSTKEDVERLLDKEPFLSVKNSMTYVQGELFGQTDNKLHLDCLQKFINKNHITAQKDTQEELDSFLRKAPDTPPARRPFIDFELYLDFKGLQIQKADGERYNEFKKPFNSLDGDLCKKASSLDSRFNLRSKYRQLVTIQPKDTGMTVYIQADFHNIDHVSILMDFLRVNLQQNADFSIVHEYVKEACRELSSRYLYLCQINRLATKEDFYYNLKNTSVSDWPALFNDALAVKKIYIPGLSGEGISFSWVASAGPDYAHHVASIVADYDDKKGIGRTMFGNSDVIKQFAGSQNATVVARKEMVADFFATLIYDTKWKPSAAAEEQLSASASAIVSANKRK